MPYRTPKYVAFRPLDVQRGYGLVVLDDLDIVYSVPVIGEIKYRFHASHYSLPWIGRFWFVRLRSNNLRRSLYIMYLGSAMASVLSGNANQNPQYKSSTVYYMGQPLITGF